MHCRILVWSRLAAMVVLRAISLEYCSALRSSKTSSFEWTDTGGSKITNQTGNYSETNFMHAFNAPGAGFASATWTDAEGNLWLHGGSGYENSAMQVGFLNDG